MTKEWECCEQYAMIIIVVVFASFTPIMVSQVTIAIVGILVNVFYCSVSLYVSSSTLKFKTLDLCYSEN